MVDRKHIRYKKTNEPNTELNSSKIDSKRILTIYETQNINHVLDSLYLSSTEKIKHPEIGMVIRSNDGIINVKLTENIESGSNLVLLNIETPIITNIAEICNLCCEKKIGLCLVTDSMEKYKNQTCVYEKYLTEYFSENSSNHTRIHDTSYPLIISHTPFVGIFGICPAVESLEMFYPNDKD